MAKIINEQNEVKDCFVAETFKGLADHDVLGTLSLQQAEAVIVLLAESHDEGFEAGKEYSFTTEYSKQREKEEQNKIKKTVQKALNESLEMLNKNYGDK